MYFSRTGDPGSSRGFYREATRLRLRLPNSTADLAVDAAAAVLTLSASAYVTAEVRSRPARSNTSSTRMEKAHCDGVSDAVSPVTHGADQVFDQVLERHHRGHAAIGDGDEGQVAVVAAQPRQRIGSGSDSDTRGNERTIEASRTASGSLIRGSTSLMCR